MILIDTQLKYLIGIYTIATILTFALDWQLPGFKQMTELSKKINLDRYLIPDYMTYWQFTHFLTRLVLGFFCPKYWQLIFVIDFSWETLEWYKWQAHNWYDLIWNMLGLITGMMLRHYGLFKQYFDAKKDDELVNKDVQSTSVDKINDQDTKEKDNDVVPSENKLRSRSKSNERGSSDKMDVTHKLINETELNANNTSIQKEYDQIPESHAYYFSNKGHSGVELNDGAKIADISNFGKKKRDKEKHKIKKQKKDKTYKRNK